MQCRDNCGMSYRFHSNLRCDLWRRVRAFLCVSLRYVQLVGR